MPVLSWIGKEKVVNHASEVPFHVLERSYSYGDAGKTAEDNGSGPKGLASRRNKIIHGDNLVALKSLLPEYEGRVKCIYIDPPYNTGNEGWVYNDNVNDPRIKKWLGEVVGKEGEDLSRHDKWLCMMYPRLKLLQRLLADDGAIFISIDDNEQANLKLICDEIFGAGNFVANVIWQHSIQSNGYKGKFVSQYNHLLVYSKSTKFAVGNLSRSDENNKLYKNPDNDPRGPWRTGYCVNGLYRPNLKYQIQTPNGKIIEPPEKGWRWSKETLDGKIRTGEIIFNEDETNIIHKLYLSNLEGKVPENLWLAKDAGATRNATALLKDIFGGTAPFDTPKPTQLIERILQIATDKNSIILDSFAGSGTTAHAVLNLNKADGGNRKFILVEMMDYAESITAERVKRVIDGYGDGKKKTEGTGGDFSFYEVGEALFSDGVLNENIEEEKIRAYIWYTETRTPYQKPTGANTDFLGCADGTAVYFHYQKDKTTTLDAAFLKRIKEKAERYVIYADVCTLAPDMMETRNIVFKKIPRDIRKI